MFCGKCKGFLGFLLLVAGILFLLRDLNIWAFWNIQWWTVLFILFGAGKLCAAKCPGCVESCDMKGKKKK